MTKSTKIIAALGVAAGLGIAALPAGSIFATDLIPFDYTTATSADKDVTVKLTVSESIAIATEGDECDAGRVTVKSTASCTQKIAGGTNAKYGFTLSVKDKDSDTSLNLDGTTTAVSNDEIEAVAGTLGGSASWVSGWNLTGGALNQAAISATEQTVMKTSAAKDAQISMVYNVATKPNQTVGNYSDVITYTIAKNNSAVATEEGMSGATVVNN